jgi:hypothetical protein
MNDGIISLYSALLANIGRPQEIGRDKTVRDHNFGFHLATFK